MKLLQLFLIFSPITLYAHGAVAITIAISFISISLSISVVKFFCLKYLEDISMKHWPFKLFLLSVVEIAILVILYGGCSNAPIWDIMKVTLYLFFPLAIVANYILLISILKHRTKAMKYAIVFVLLNISLSWGFTISKFECNTSDRLQMCNFFKLPHLEKFEFFGMKHFQHR